MIAASHRIELETRGSGFSIVGPGLSFGDFAVEGARTTL